MSDQHAAAVSTEVTNRPENAGQLAELIESLTVFDYVEGGEGYEKAADAMWRAALVAFDYAARKVGATGFQASWSALRFYGEAMHVDGPFLVMQLHDALYPQYDLPDRLAKFIEEQRPWLREQAAEKLAEDENRDRSQLGASPAVVAHWRKLADDA